MGCFCFFGCIYSNQLASIPPCSPTIHCCAACAYPLHVPGANRGPLDKWAVLRLVVARCPGALPCALKLLWQSTHIALLPPYPGILLPATIRVDLGPAHRESDLRPRRASEEVIFRQVARSLKVHKKTTQRKMSTIRLYHGAKRSARKAARANSLKTVDRQACAGHCLRSRAGGFSRKPRLSFPTSDAAQVGTSATL